MDKELMLLQEISRTRDIPKNIDRAEMTPLMHIAYATYSPERAFSELKGEEWTKRLGRMAVLYDFRNIRVVPEDFKKLYAGEFAAGSTNLTRGDVDEFSEIMESDGDFTISVLKHKPGLRRFLKDGGESLRKPSKNKQVTEYTRGFTQNEKFDFMSAELADINEQDAETFLSLPAEEQTLERLIALTESNADFPVDFIKRLQTPHRNEAFYKKRGDEDKAAFWASKKIPYLNLDICQKIAYAHPEGSVMTPAYLSKEGVRGFWELKKEEDTAKARMSEYFIMFPEELLDPKMAEDLQMNWQVLAHAPNIFCGSEKARLHLNRKPNDILRLPECYQEERRLIADGVRLNADTVQYIKNDLEREKIKVAFDIHTKPEIDIA